MKAASARVPVNKGAKLPGEVLEAWEVVALIRACGRGPAGVRNAALIAIMFGAGLRVSEALALKVSDLNLSNGTVRVRHGKGDRARTVALDPSAQAYVERWLGPARAAGAQRSPAALLHDQPNERFGGQMDSSYVRRAATASRGSRWPRAASPPARAPALARDRARARRQAAARHHRPARPLVHSSHRPVPGQDRPR